MFPRLSLLLVTLLLSAAGCRPVSDPLQTETTAGLWADIPPDHADFSMTFDKATSAETGLQGPFVLRGFDLHYVDSLGILSVNLSVTNESNTSHPEPVRLRFDRLLPESIRVVDADNGLEGPGAELQFEFANDDAQWTPGETSLPRPLSLEVAPGLSVGFLAELLVGAEAPGGSISGVVWSDLDADGVRDPLEPGLDGILVVLDGDVSSPSGSLHRETITDPDGSYRFAGLESGVYFVSPPAGSGCVATTETPMHVLLVQQNGVVIDFEGADFGCTASSESIWWGTRGSGPGEFDYPCAIGLDEAENLYVADVDNHRIQKFDADGVFLLQWGSLGTLAGQFNRPCGVEVGPSGDVYVADLGNHRVQVFTASGEFIRTFGTSGQLPGQFLRPRDVALDDEGHVYVVESDGNRVQRFSPTGVHEFTWGVAGSSAGQFQGPKGIAVDSNGYVYVADDGNYRVQKFTTYGTFVLAWGAPGSRQGEFYSPVGIDVGPDDTVYVTDAYNHRVQMFDPRGTYLSMLGVVGSGPGQFRIPYDVAVSRNGHLYVAEAGNFRIQRFEVGSFLP